MSRAWKLFFVFVVVYDVWLWTNISHKVCLIIIAMQVVAFCAGYIVEDFIRWRKRR